MKADLHFIASEGRSFIVQYISSRGKEFLDTVNLLEIGGKALSSQEIYSNAVESGLKVSFETAAVRDALTPKFVR